MAHIPGVRLSQLPQEAAAVEAFQAHLRANFRSDTAARALQLFQMAGGERAW